MNSNTLDELLKPQKQETQKMSEKKWGKEVLKSGFNIFPSLLIKAQAKLGLDCKHMTVLLHLTDIWWDVSRKPWPTVKYLSMQIGISHRTVQRILAELETGGFIRRIHRYEQHRGRTSNEFDLSGLVEKLKEIAPEVNAANEEAKKIKEKAIRRKRPSLPKTSKLQVVPKS